MPEEPILGQDSDKLTVQQRHQKVMGLMILGFLMKRKKLISLVIGLAIITAILLTYFILI